MSSSKTMRIAGLGIQLAGRELAADTQLLALSFLELPELLCMFGVSRGWRSKAEEVLSRLEYYANFEARDLKCALQYCRRLRTLDGAYSAPLDLSLLVEQNLATLTDISLPADWPDILWEAVYKCRSLRRLVTDSWARLKREETLRLMTAFPELQELSATLDWGALLSAPVRPPLRRLGGVARPLTSANLSLLPSAFPLLEALSIISTDAASATLFSVLACLPHLAELFLLHSDNPSAPPPQDEPQPVLPALRSLSLHSSGYGYGEGPLQLPSLLPHFSAPGVQSLTLGRSVSAPLAPLVARFPALTSLSIARPGVVDGGSEGDDMKEAIRLLNCTPKPWQELSVLHLSRFYDLRAEKQPRYCVSFLLELGSGGRLPALSELHLDRAVLTPPRLLRLLHTFPGLTSVRIAYAEWEEEDGDRSEAEGTEQQQQHGLEKLSIVRSSVGVLRTLASGPFRFPRLRILALEDLIPPPSSNSEGEAHAYNPMPLLLGCREALQEVLITRSNCLSLSFPAGTPKAAMVFPRLVTVKYRPDKDCRVTTQVYRALIPN